MQEHRELIFIVLAGVSPNLYGINLKNRRITHLIPLYFVKIIPLMNKIFRFIYIFCVILLGVVFFTSGMGKLFYKHNFFGFIGPVWLEDKLVEYNLGLFARFIGYAQVTIGYLLLTYRFRFIASIILVPMLVNILIIVISLHWQGTPYLVAFLLLQNIYLLIYDHKQYLHLITGKFANIETQNKNKLGGNLICLLGYALSLISIQISFVNLQTAWIFSIISLLTGVFAGKIDKTYFHKL